jgi:hypothetical protein
LRLPLQPRCRPIEDVIHRLFNVVSNCEITRDCGQARQIGPQHAENLVNKGKRFLSLAQLADPCAVRNSISWARAAATRVWDAALVPRRPSSRAYFRTP